MRFIRSFASLAALLGGLALLLADDAGPQCQLGAFDRSFTIASTCGPVSETIRVTVADSAETGTIAAGIVEHVGGDTFTTSADLSGSCAADDGPIEYTSLNLDVTLFGADGSGGPNLCNINLETLVAHCTPVREGTGTCTVTVTAL